MPQGMSNTWYALAKNPDESTDVTVYDEIGAWGISAKQFIKDLAGVKGHINLRINSPGGSITDGTAIIAALQRHKAGFTAWVDGLAASMASVIACAADQCYMADGAMMMIHRASTISMGDAADLRKDADLLEKFEKSLVNVYAKKTGLSADEINAMLAAETWLDPLEAIALGFADGISETPAATALLTPDQMRAKFDTFKKGMIEKPLNEDKPEEEMVAATVEEAVAVVVEIAAIVAHAANQPLVHRSKRKAAVTQRIGTGLKPFWLAAPKLAAPKLVAGVLPPQPNAYDQTLRQWFASCGKSFALFALSIMQRARRKDI